MDLTRSNVIVVLPRDITEEILSRSPLKTLLRFKCVSKSFNALISAPSVARLHLYRSNPQSNILTSTRFGIGLLEHETCFHYKFRLDYPSPRHHVPTIMGYCHGLVTIAIPVTDNLQSKKGIYVCNPSIGDVKKLPDHPKSNELILLNGIGYDSCSDDYKVFICTEDIYKTTTVSIFSLRKNSWRLMTQPLPTNNCVFHPRFGSFLNGALHWVSRGLQPELILVFDLRLEKFFYLPVPKVSSQLFIINMGIFDGRLCLTYYDQNYKRARGRPLSSGPVEVRVMKDYGVKESWTKLAITANKYRHHHLPLCTSTGNQVILINQEKELVRSTAEKELEKFKICNCTREEYKSISEHECQAISYAGSLISPNNINCML